MVHPDLNLTILYEKMYDAPIICKIMLFLVLKNSAAGIVTGIREFKLSEHPITNFYHHLLSNTLWGCIEAVFWPVTLPYSILSSLDAIANWMKKSR